MSDLANWELNHLKGQRKFLDEPRSMLDVLEAKELSDNSIGSSCNEQMVCVRMEH